jgi:hypothetical protein
VYLKGHTESKELLKVIKSDNHFTVNFVASVVFQNSGCPNNFCLKILPGVDVNFPYRFILEHPGSF